MNNTERFQYYFQLLKESLLQIKEDEDRKLVESDIDSLA